MRALSPDTTSPQEASRPFDRERDGFVMAEGRYAYPGRTAPSPRRRGAHIYGEIIGYGSAGDAYHLTAPCGRCWSSALYGQCSERIWHIR